MELALIYDGAETLAVTRKQAESLEFFGLVTYSPEDGPMGIVWRPWLGNTIEDCEAALGLEERIEATKSDLGQIQDWLQEQG